MLQDDIDGKFLNLRHRLGQLEKKTDDVFWYHRVGDVAYIDKIFMTGPPPRGAEKATTLIDQNPVKLWTYVFIPKDIDPDQQYPLLVFPRGGVHANFNTYYTHIIREMMVQ
jgi:dipeptidyl aminopeptidase/acylaminoacyl peptidase